MQTWSATGQLKVVLGVVAIDCGARPMKCPGRTFLFWSIKINLLTGPFAHCYNQINIRYVMLYNSTANQRRSNTIYLNHRSIDGVT
jgi:hypothetical protein